MKGVADVTLNLWVVTPAGGTSGQPKCRYINLELCPGPTLSGSDFKACLLLENPQGFNYLTYDGLLREVSLVKPF